MKKVVYISLLTLIAVSFNSCVINIDSVYGDGNVVSEERDIGDFNRLKVSSGVDVIIKQGSEVSLLLEADKNLHDVIRTEVQDNTLRIYTNKSIRKAKSKQVYLVYEDLNAIRVSSAGDVKGENTLKTEYLELDLSSAGDLKLDVKAIEIDCDISSSGDARISGSTESLFADLSSAGDLYAFDLHAEKVKVRCSSAGDARVYASEEIRARSSSAGNIYYTGEGKLIESHSSSAGSIRKK